MNRYGHPHLRWQRLRQIGRIGFALAAGGAFAALSWNPTPAQDQNNKNTPSSSHPNLAKRSGVVTEDDAPSRFTFPAYGIDGEDQWGLSRSRTQLDVSEQGMNFDGHAALDVEARARTVPAQDGAEKTTAFRQPRGPP